MTESDVLPGGQGQKALTIPMQLSLYSMLRGEQIPYPGGQRRFIRLGLYNRGLIRSDGSLSANGRFMARQIERKVLDKTIADEWGLAES